MVAALASVASAAPAFLTHAFNPVILNLAVAALGVLGWIAHPSTAFAGGCLRRTIGENR